MPSVIVMDCMKLQVALNWLLLQGNVVPIPGAKSAAQVTYSEQQPETSCMLHI